MGLMPPPMQTAYHWYYNAMLNKCVHPPYTRAEMYVGRVTYCPLVSHFEYVQHTLLRLEKDEKDGRTDGRTDGCHTIALCLLLDTATV